MKMTSSEFLFWLKKIEEFVKEIWAHDNEE